MIPTTATIYAERICRAVSRLCHSCSAILHSGSSCLKPLCHSANSLSSNRAIFLRSSDLKSSRCCRTCAASDSSFSSCCNRSRPLSLINFVSVRTGKPSPLGKTTPSRHPSFMSSVTITTSSCVGLSESVISNRFRNMRMCACRGVSLLILGEAKPPLFYMDFGNRVGGFFIFIFNRSKTNFTWWKFGIVVGNYYRKNNLFNRSNERNRNLIRKAMNPQKIIIINADVSNIIFPSTSRANHIYGLALFKSTCESFIFLKGCVCQLESTSLVLDLPFKKGV